MYLYQLVSKIFYINDILDENGEISHYYILDKLKYKINWIFEFICLTKAIPNEWYNTLQAQISIKSAVNFQKDKFIVNGKCIELSQLSNKYFYNEYINVKFLKPIACILICLKYNNDLFPHFHLKYH
jgi:hypothetical protein